MSRTLSFPTPRGVAPTQEHCPGAFLALARATQQPDPGTSYQPDGLGPHHLSVDTTEFIFDLWYADDDQIAFSADRNVMVMIHGEIYYPETRQHQEVIERYERAGPDFAEDIDGSFAILVVDKRRGFFFAATDRLNSRKVFCCLVDGTLALSSSQSFLPAFDTKLDTSAVACYLAHGALHSTRTLFQNVRILDRASVYYCAPGHITRRCYWNLEFTHAYEGMSYTKLKRELLDRMTESTKRCVGGEQEVILSLSGGYDATGILGILAREIALPGVTCFSYAHGEPCSTSDEAVAAKRAAICGYPHDIVPSFSGKLTDTIEINASIGEGISHFCHEVSTYTQLGAQYIGQRRPVLLVGDEWFGWGCRIYQSREDIHQSLHTGSFGQLTWLKEYVGSELVESFSRKVENEQNHMIERCPRYEDWLDTLDYLYLDLRLSHVLMPARHYFANLAFRVAEPFLRRPVLDFMTAVPPQGRFCKQLFRDVVTERYPDIFETPNATSGNFTDYWKVELWSQKEQVIASIRQGASLLDDVIPAETLIKVLEDYRPAAHDSKSNRNRWAAKPECNSYAMMDPATFLERALVMRQFLAGIPAQRPLNFNAA